MNYTEELKNILLEYTKKFPTHLFLETDSLSLQIIQDANSNEKYNFEIREKSNSEKPYKPRSNKRDLKYSGYINKKGLHPSSLIVKKEFADKLYELKGSL